MDIDSIDEKFIQRCLRNEEKAWRQLFKEGYKIAWFTAHSAPFGFSEAVCDDIAQETMIVVCRKIETIRNFRAFIIRTAHNKSVDVLRKVKYVSEEYKDNLHSEQFPSYLPETMDNSEVLEKLKDIVESIPEPCNNFLRYRYFFELSYKEIAEKMLVKVNEVGVYLARCITALRRFLRFDRDILKELELILKN